MKEPNSKPKEKISKDDPRYFDQRTVQAGKDIQKLAIASIIITAVLILVVFVVRNFL